MAAKVPLHSIAIVAVVGLLALLLASSTSADAQAAAGCAPAVRDEFHRQQSIVERTVYCPTSLPADLQTEGVNGGMNPGGGLFSVTLASPAGAEMVIIQGAGASIFARHISAGPPEEPAGDAQFGDLPGEFFTAEPPAVKAFDADGFGHSVTASGIGLKALIEVAAGMQPVPPALPDTGAGGGSGARVPDLPVLALAATLLLAGAAATWVARRARRRA